MNRRSLIIWLIMAVAAVMLIRYCSTNQESTSPVSEEPATFVTAETLHAAYVRNEVAADNKYKDKMVEVSGTVSSISTFGDEPVVNLLGSDRLGGVQCYFDPKQRETVARIERGNLASFKCKCDGFINDVVLATGCVVLSHHP